MTSESPGAFVAHLSWDAVEQRVAKGAVGVLPIGAACKEHGLHLPMQADWLQAQCLAEALVQCRDVLVWPTVGYGYYPAFTDYPGSVSLSAKTFRRMLHEILGAIHHGGVRRVLILNTGISTIEPLQAVVQTLPTELRVRLAHVYDGPCYRRVAGELEQQTGGSHGDELETSILLAIDAAGVRLEQAQPWTPTNFPERGPFSRDPHDPRFSPSGVWGDPTLASADKGRRLLDAIVEDLLAHLEAIPR